jgi:hypothetical protein
VADPNFPNHLQELLLQAALLRDPFSSSAWDAWLSETDGLDNCDWSTHRILPLVYRTLAAGDGPQPEIERLKGLYRRSWYLNQRHLREAGHIVAAMNTAGIETIVLKGASLIARYYDDPGVRPMGDLDVLVHQGDAPRAMQVLIGEGWNPVSDVRWERLAVTHHAVSHVRSGGIEVDLHWDLSPRRWRSDMWTGTSSIDVGGVTTSALSPPLELLHVLTHGIRHFGQPLGWVADAVMITRSGDVAWDDFIRAVVVERPGPRVLTALKYLRDTFAAPIPPGVFDQLDRTDLGGRAERLADWFLEHDVRHGSGYPEYYIELRRLREASADLQLPRSYSEYLQWHWQASSRRELGVRLLRKAAQIARSGKSHPSGLAVWQDSQ